MVAETIATELAIFQALLTAVGQQVLAEAEKLLNERVPTLSALTRLRRLAAAPLATAAWEQATLRQRASASGKLPQAAQLYFTPEALEQATGAVVAGYRAQRYRGLGVIADLGCGIGGDCLALAAQQPVIAVDRDRLRLAILQENARVLGLAEQILPVCADLEQWALPAVAALFCDPARRTTAGRRIFAPEAYQPPLATIAGWQTTVPAIGVKVAPGLLRQHWPDPAIAEVEFISVGGELKEAALWYGPLRTVARRATLLPAGVTLSADTEVAAGAVPITASGGYLYEPDPAVIRAGLVENLALLLGATKIDATIAYLTTDQVQPTPFARAYAIAATLPFGLKRLRAWLREHDAGEVTVKKRGSPLDTTQLAQQLRGRGAQPYTVILTHNAGRPVALVGRPVVTPG